MINAKKSLELLKEGNKRYVKEPSLHYSELDKKRLESSMGQKPIAVVLACADSRVPVELIFHCYPGELFVIRVAGNILNNDVLASIEYAIAHLKTNLIVVLGHSFCGAVTAAIQKENLSKELNSLLNKIHLHPQSTDINQNVIFNAERVAEELQDKLNQWDTEDRYIKVVSAFYHIDSGIVDFGE